MSRISERMKRLRARGQKALIGFVTAGDPNLDRTVEIALDLERGGVDVLELGVPFSDPLADGPVIQRASERALRRGTTFASVLGVVGRIRARSDLPLLLFTYVNPVMRFGMERAAQASRKAGADGVLLTDMPPEEAGDWLGIARGEGLDTVFLAAPTSPKPRLKRAAEASSGFVYAVSRTGVTGETLNLSADAGPLVAQLRALTSEPVVLGFGISTPRQVAEAASIADGAVVGTALVRFIEEHPDGDMAEKARWFRSGL